jgi:hypothetical protein
MISDGIGSTPRDQSAAIATQRPKPIDCREVRFWHKADSFRRRTACLLLGVKRTSRISYLKGLLLTQSGH